MVELARRPGAGGAAAVHEELLEGPAALRDPGYLGGPEPVGPACEARDRAAPVEDRMGPRLGLVDHRRGGRAAVGRLEDHGSRHRISPWCDHDGDWPGELARGLRAPGRGRPGASPAGRRPHRGRDGRACRTSGHRRRVRRGASRRLATGAGGSEGGGSGQRRAG